MWQFSKRYWPQSHMQIVKHITGLLSKGTRVTYLTGNHDEMLRKFAGFRLGNFQIANKKVIQLSGKSAWIFHGDVFDVTMQHSKWLAKLGAVGYDTLIVLNTFVNFVMRVFGRGKISLSKKIKDSVKQAVKFINDFERTAADIAIENGYNYVICGHIHQPEMKEIINHHGSIMYLNSGDWIENLTALEYNNGEWVIYKYDEATMMKIREDEEEPEPSNNQLFTNLLEEFNIMTVS